ncbi:erythrocyte membrane protein 1, PfEMP1, putative [Plasmodium sp. gorilla clade G2]|uniref:erythrocyte membrane protein 1, PfEMP1, putative n=1 Tax=Plasmodium sp. gorilla clade G2 TaxID=880535 RepID=UPI000D28F933|nr:erythrocyte membrane protein 1, PfEMP1, putative [Plasmodium sp. gorilla clade G2]SOV20306.1 erythrocyte membrane protein 1, PfEMP1, putative [Plasmodium sp. gorilla clade G2]
MPTKTSTNRYIPYKSDRYAGRTYIYVENDNDSDNYVVTTDTSDITSSSESEYEEIDINDIYPYKSPKYKTLIEVVLKPSKTYDAENIHIDNNMEDNNDTPINKLTDVEWNQLKHDFISQYLEIIPKDLPNENTIDDNIYMDTQTNIVDSSMEEKPFITSIQDRFLDNIGQDITYNINWNIPKNIRTNTTDYPKYVTSNDKYSGIDLINDSLNNDQHIDIYDELLKRKENELFGTKHPKNTTTNKVAKPISGDPILNQIELFDKWLERHRNNQWNIQRDTLNQWKNKPDNNIPVENVHTTHKLLNTNLSIEISSDDIPRSNMDMSGTNRYAYLDDMDSFENSGDENLL